MIRMNAFRHVAGRRSRPLGFLPALIVLFATATASAQADRQPPDPLDGPPYTTVKAWAIADGRTGAILWGHNEKEKPEPASTTKDHDGAGRGAADGEGPRGPRRDRHLLEAGRRDDWIELRGPRGRTAARPRVALWLAPSIGQ